MVTCPYMGIRHMGIEVAAVSATPDARAGVMSRCNHRGIVGHCSKSRVGFVSQLGTAPPIYLTRPPPAYTTRHCATCALSSAIRRRSSAMLGFKDWVHGLEVPVGPKLGTQIRDRYCEFELGLGSKKM